MPTTAHKRHRIDTGGPWGTGLLILSVLAVVIGISYVSRAKGSVPDALQALAVPVWLWASLWIVAGVYGAWKALRPPQHHRDVWPFAGLTFMWSAAYTVHWLIVGSHGEWTSSWTGAVVWAAFGGLVVSWGGRCVNPARR